MIEIILLIVGIIYAVRRPKLRRLKPQDFPGVDSAKFLTWQRAEITAIDVFLWATWGAFLLKIGLTILLSDVRLGDTTGVIVMVAIIVAWLGGLTVAAVMGSRAKELRTKAGISKWDVDLSALRAREGETGRMGASVNRCQSCGCSLGCEADPNGHPGATLCSSCAATWHR